MPNHPFPLRALLTLALLGLAGCGGEYSHVNPPQVKAREGLELALAAWKDGKRPDAVDGAAKLKVFDTAWLGGQKLASYQVVGEDESDGQKRFTVKLSLNPPKGEQEVRYIVVGDDPLWVYREEDFLKDMNMENKPEPEPKPAGQRR